MIKMGGAPSSPAAPTAAHPKRVYVKHEEDYEQDKEALAKLLPDELWKKLAECIEDPADKENFGDASLVFRRLLVPTRQELLFPQVWKILAPRLDVLLEETEIIDDEQRQQDDLRKCSFRKTALDLRLVCRSFKSGVDQLCEDLGYRKGSSLFNTDPVHFPFPGRTFDMDDKADEWGWDYSDTKPDGTGYFGTWLEERFEDVARLERYLDLFKSSPAAPVGKHVTFDFGAAAQACHRDGPMFKRFTNGVNTFMKNHGRRLRGCSFLYEGDHWQSCTNKQDCFANIRKWMTLMPKLKLFRCKLNLMPKMTDDEVEETVTSFQSQGVSRLVHLQALYLEGIPEPITAAILQPNNDVQVFQNLHLAYPQRTFKVGVALLNLNQLSVDITKAESVHEFFALENFQNNWQLKSIAVRFSTKLTAIPGDPWRRIFRLLERWQGSLQTVNITMPRVLFLEDALNLVSDTGLTVNLPYVKRLRLTCQFPPLILKFFRPLINSLEYLEVYDFPETPLPGWNETTWESQIKELPKQDIDLSGPLYSSNIWTAFRKLQRLDYTVNETTKRYFRRFAKTCIQQTHNQ